MTHRIEGKMKVRNPQKARAPYTRESAVAEFIRQYGNSPGLPFTRENMRIQPEEFGMVFTESNQSHYAEG